MSDGLSIRCKEFESAEVSRAAMPGLPIIARLDGRAFHTFTRGLRRPYDGDMSRCMIETTRYLVEKTHPAIGYTQSDEITLAWPMIKPETEDARQSEPLFGGRWQKMTSVLAGMASVRFYQLVLEHLPAKAASVPHFDCRVWQVPSLREVVDVLIWREDDATRNSILMAGQSHYSHKEMHGKHTGEVQDMLHAKGVNWNDYPAFFKRGTYLKRETRMRALTDAERARIPEAHRPEPDATFERSQVNELNMPPIRHIEWQERLTRLFGV